MGEKQRKTSVEKQIASINTDYVRSIERQEKRKRQKKFVYIRRLSVFAIMPL